MILDRLFTGSAGSDALTFLIEAVFKGTSLLILAAVLALALRRGSAAHRHLVWACALTSLVLLPILLAALPAWRVSVPALAWLAPGSRSLVPQVASPAPAGDATTGPSAPAGSAPSAVEPATTAGGATPSPAANAVPATTPTPPRIVPWPAVVLTLWAIGALAVLATFVAGHAMLRLLLRGVHPVREGEWHALANEAADRLGLTLPFALLRGEGVLVPVAFGLVRPRVLLPAGCDAWPVELRRAVLLHELAHVQRHDCLTQAVAQLACALFWFHPAVWWAASRLQVERERACDDRVLAARTRASDYADHLLGMVRSLRATRLAALGAVAFARPSSLEGRLLAVLDPRRNRVAVGPRVAAPAALIAALLVLSFAVFEPVAAVTVRGHWKQAVKRPTADLNDLRPSRVVPVADPGRSLEERAGWARTDAGRSGDDAWWIGWIIDTDSRHKGGLLSDSEGISLELFNRPGAFTLEDVLAGRGQGTSNANGHSRRNEEESKPVALLVRMTAGGPDRVRVQSQELPVELWGEPLYWLDAVPEEQSFAWLRGAAERGRTERMRGQLVETIGFMRNSRIVVPYLTAMFRGSGPARVRANAAEGLAHHPSSEVVRLLADGARTDPSPEVRRACAEGLGKCQTPEALEALLAIARASEGPVRRAAFDAIEDKVSRQAPDQGAGSEEPSGADAPDAGEQQGDGAKQDKAGKHKGKDAGQYVGDSGVLDESSQPMPIAEQEVQRQAIEALGRYPEAQSLQRLWRIAETSPDGDLRAAAVESIGRLKTPAALSVLDQIVWKNRQARARQAAVEMLGRHFPPDQALEKLLRVARTHPSGETRRMAVEMLGRVEGPAAAEALDHIVAKGGDPGAQRQAVESLGRRDEEGVERKLMDIARTHGSVEVRRQAVESLGRRDGKAIADQLMTIARADVPQDVQRQAAESLGRIADPRAKGMLLELARSHPVIDVERQAVESLGRLEGDVMGELAQIARSHPSGEVRRQAVESMTRRDPDQALPLLEEILRRPQQKGGT